MIELGILEGILLVPVSFGLAFAMIRLNDRLGRPSKKLKDQAGSIPQNKAVFLFQEGILLDANSAGQNMLLAPGENKSDWAFLYGLLEPRFPEFPAAQGTDKTRDMRTFSARDGDEKEFVVLEQWDKLARVTLQKTSNSDTVESQTTTVSTSMHVIAEAPYPVWRSNQNGDVDWANAAYYKLAENLGIECNGNTSPKVFEQSTLVTGQKPVRTSVADESRTQNYWFDVTTTKTNGVRNHFATDANAIVNAEIAQRNFVQTLTKTFAQLSIGLAIFDRNRQLALFNPALIDLTALPADFLSSRPNLLAFFDRMRENRMMPEPRNYSSWREQIAELVVAASDDRYTETWTLPSGVTYRVLGRPHPDGAIAFLFEDISAEVSLNRRFRAEMELGKSTLDSLNQAIVVLRRRAS